MITSPIQGNRRVLPGKASASWTSYTAAMAALLAVSCLQPADEIIDRNGAKAIVFVKETSIGDGKSPMVANAGNREFFPGSDLYMLQPISPSGALTNLTEKWTRASASSSNWGAAADPEVSFDGRRILFSMREARTGSSNRRWQVYELDLETGRLTALTAPAVGDDIDPAYIDDNHIVFGSTRNQVIDEYERQAAPQLFVGERGAPGEALRNIRQITFNQSHDQNPIVHSSGKIYFSRWDHLGDPNKIPLFTVDADGTRQFVLYGADETFAGTGLSSGQRVFMEARELSDGGLVASMMERTSDFEGGAIAIIDLSRFTSPPEMVTPSTSPYNTDRQKSNAIFKTPYPVMDGGKERLLVAQSAREVGGDIQNASVNFDLFVMDKDGKNMRVVHTDPGTNDYDPVVVTPRAVLPKAYAPNPGVAEAIARGDKTGIFFTANVYSRMDNDGHMKPDPNLVNSDGTKGQARYVRFLEAVSMPAASGMRGATVGNRTEFEKQRVIGYGDIREDGSFSAEVPANTPLHLQVLDENGMMLVNQLQWINVMPGEKRVCTGCHGPRERDTDIQHFENRNDTVKYGLEPTRNYFSGFYNAQKVTAHPSAKSDTVDFIDLADLSRTNTIQHIFNTSCNSCHGASVAAAQGGSLVLENGIADSAARQEGISSVYDILTRSPRESSPNAGYQTAKAGTRLPYLTSDGARSSPLAWVLYNRQLGRKTETLFRTPSHDHSALWKKDSTGRIEPFAKENAGLLTLIEWIDGGIQFSNSVGKRAN